MDFNQIKGTGTGGNKVGLVDVGGQNTGNRQVLGKVVGTPQIGSGSGKGSGPGVAASNGLSQEEVMKVVNQHLHEIQRCYERSLFKNPDLVGRGEYEWFISPNGDVTQVRVVSSTLVNGDELHNCVMSVFKKMKFPKSTNGQPTIASVAFPFGK